MRTLAFTTLGLLAAASTAHAQEGSMPDWANKNGAFGIGANTTLGGSNGLNIRTYVTPQFGLHATIGFELESIDVGDGAQTSSETAFQIGLHGAYKLAYWQRGHLSAIFGVDVQTLSLSDEFMGTTSEASATDILIGVGAMGEWFPTQYLSLFLQVGLSLDFIGEDELVGGDQIVSNPDQSGIILDLSAQPLGMAGFTVWFK